MALGSAGAGVTVYRFPEWAPIDHCDDPGVISRLEFSRDGRLLASAGERVLVREFKGRRNLAGPLDHPAAVMHLVFNVRGDRLATAAADGKARVFALPERPDRHGPLFPPVTHLGRFSRPEDPVRPMFVDGDRAFITLLKDGRLCWRDAETGRDVRSTEGERDISRLYLSPDGRTLVSGASPRVHGLELWDVATGKLTGEIPFNGPDGVGFSNDGSILLVGGANHSAQLWSPLSKQPLGPIMTHQAVVNQAAVSPNQSIVATAQSDGVVRVWQVPRTSARSIPVEGSYNHAAMTRDGKFVLPFSSDLRSGPTTGEVYEVRTGDVVARLDVGGVLHGAVFSPDGRNVITLSSATDKPVDDGYFYIPGRRPGWFRTWDWTSARPLHDSVAVPSEPVGAAYSPVGA
jgi:WD40 repeat protein